MTDERRFTPEQDQYLRDNWHKATRLIGDGLGGKSANAVLSRGRKIGLPARPAEVLSLVWTKEMDAQLDKLITVERLSYRCAGDRLGMKVTQVASRCRILKIQAAVLPGFRNAGSQGIKANPAQPKPVELEISPEEVDQIVATARVVRNGRTIEQCNFPVRTIGHRHFFCGEPVQPGSVYCPACHSRCYTRIVSQSTVGGFSLRR